MGRRRHGGSVSERERRAKETLRWTNRRREGAQMGDGWDGGLPRRGSHAGVAMKRRRLMHVWVGG
jgi:hypothetical protein